MACLVETPQNIMMDAALIVAPTVVLMGLSFGASACMVACIPTLGVTLLAEQGGTGATMKLAARFNAGRWFGYSMLGMISGIIGASITLGLDSKQAAWLFGAFLLFAGFALFRRSKTLMCSHHGKHRDAMFKGSMFSLGVGMSLTPCVPLAGVCAAAASTGSATSGLILGAAFGFGAIIPAQLLLGYGLGMAGQEMRQQLSNHAPKFAHIAATVLILTGIGVISGVVQL